MDVEQRIGRIHRYGQRDTAQVYNIVSADTMEGHDFGPAGGANLLRATVPGRRPRP